TCRIVLTVPPGQDPIQTRDRIFQNLTIADSGQQTQGVNTLVDSGNNPLGDLINIGTLTGVSRIGASSLNLRPFLDQRDGGTGTQLRGGISTNSGGRRLNPGSFR
ncbi:MAG: COP23 domain-containing protein, partial [Cyanobacteria bacterium]|nr:COP23 domain-containing protein [Cyanobacteriota bacterium]MDW8202402.1 COP23 domain-containing protein [Cyanobacteriota bacterium SKYGB_h_bin112]